MLVGGMVILPAVLSYRYAKRMQAQTNHTDI